jgi:hypothetical protein
MTRNFDKYVGEPVSAVVTAIESEYPHLTVIKCKMYTVVDASYADADVRVVYDPLSFRVTRITHRHSA